MEFASDGRVPPASGIDRAAQAFGRPIGLLTAPPAGVPRLVQVESSDDAVHAVEVGYGTDARSVHVRTERRDDDTDVTTHSLVDALANYAAGLGPDEDPRPVLRRWAGAAAAAPVRSGRVPVGGVARDARILEVDGYAAVEVRLPGLSVVCLAPADLIEVVRLDLATW